MSAGKTTYVQDPDTGKFVEKASLSANQSAFIHTLEEFVSPIDQTIIRTPSDLRKHNLKHGVTDFRDYSPEYLAKRRKEEQSMFNKGGKQDRLNDLNAAYEKLRS